MFPLGSSRRSLDDLAEGATVATGSPRRQSQLLAARPDLHLCEVRGNVETRLRKLDAGEFDAMILAEAGLERLGLADRVSCTLQPPLMLPAVGQAALGIECREDDRVLRELLSSLSDAPTLREVLAERACLRTLQAGCHAPVGTFSVITRGGVQRLDVVVLSLDGRAAIRASVSSEVRSDDEAISLGEAVARDLLQQGAAALISAS